MAGILISLDNFGCGSSREHAPWALADFGIHAVMARSFAEIFRNNCYMDVILPITLANAEIDRLIALAENPATAHMKIDLPRQIITTARAVLPFEITQEHKNQLDLGSELLLDQIAAFEMSADYACPAITKIPLVGPA